MIGLILVGHGEFGKGIISSVNLIMGEQEHLEYVEFKLEHTTKDLESNLEEKVRSMEDCDGILFLTDVVGGTPFKISALLAQNVNRCRVLSGVNLPLVLEAVIKRDMEDVETLKDNLVKMGKEGIIAFEMENECIEKYEAQEGI